MTETKVLPRLSAKIMLADDNSIIKQIVTNTLALHTGGKFSPKGEEAQILYLVENLPGYIDFMTDDTRPVVPELPENPTKKQLEEHQNLVEYAENYTFDADILLESGKKIRLSSLLNSVQNFKQALSEIREAFGQSAESVSGAKNPFEGVTAKKYIVSE